MTEKTKFAKSQPFIFLVFFILGLIVLLFSFQRFLFLPKILVILLIILITTLYKKLQPLIKDWFPFIAFVYLFDSLRGAIYFITCKLGLPVYTLYVIKIENFLFKTIPSVFLQDQLLNNTSPGNFTWLEKFLTVIHGSHFVAFILVGFFIWLNRPTCFRLYKTSFYLAMFIGLLGYFFVPTVPPWMASHHFNILPPITRFNSILYNVKIPDISSGFDINPIAAMPSLHALFPILCSLLLWSLFRWKAIPFYLYTILILFTIVYTGDHYVTDILAGLILAIVCYFTALKIRKINTRNQEILFPEQSTVDFSNLVKPIIVGSIILILGILIGNNNKKEFIGHPNAYSLNAPRYVDFFRDQEKFKKNIHVQFYFGQYLLISEDYKKALPHFQQCLALADNPTQEKIIRQQINFNTQMIQTQSKLNKH